MNSEYKNYRINLVKKDLHKSSLLSKQVQLNQDLSQLRIPPWTEMLANSPSQHRMFIFWENPAASPAGIHDWVWLRLPSSSVCEKIHCLDKILGEDFSICIKCKERLTPSHSVLQEELEPITPHVFPVTPPKKGSLHLLFSPHLNTHTLTTSSRTPWYYCASADKPDETTHGSVNEDEERSESIAKKTQRPKIQYAAPGPSPKEKLYCTVI